MSESRHSKLVLAVFSLLSLKIQLILNNCAIVHLHLFAWNNCFHTTPIYGLNASGILTEPSACKLFSKNAIDILGGATTVLFNVCARYYHLTTWHRILNCLACASPRFEQLPTWEYFFCLGDHASTSTDFHLLSIPESPEQHSNVLTGMSQRAKQILLCSAIIYEPHQTILWLTHNQSFPVFQIDGFGIHLFSSIP